MGAPPRKLSSTAGIAVVLAVLLALTLPVSAQQPGRVNVLIGFAQRPGTAEQALVHAHGGQIKYAYRLVNAIAASLPLAAISALSRNPNVTVVEIDEAVHKIDAELDNTWGVKQIGAGTVHDNGFRGAGVKVAIIDTGVDYTHADLGGCFGNGCKVAGGKDFVNGDNDPMDDDGHGTHVAGTVAAAMNGVGVVGVAPDATLYALKVLDASGSGSFSAVIAALQWVVDNGIQVTSNSYGSSSNPGTIVQAAFDNAAAAGVLHVAAAGNSGNCAGKNDSVGYPAKYASAVAVGATDQSNARPCFSSTGSAVELAAPGVGINSTKLGGGYVVYSGTSMATPHVAGAAAVVIGALKSAQQSADAATVRQRLTSTATDLGAAGRDNAHGYGLVNLAAAVGGLTLPTPTPAVHVVVTTVKSSYVSGTDTTAIVTATITNENGAAIAGLDGAAGAFTSTLNSASTALGFTETATPGTYTAPLSLALAAGNYTVAVTVTDTRAVSGAGSASFSISGVPSPATVATATSITYATSGGKTGDKDLNITVQVNNDLGAAVSGATVSISLSRNGAPIASGAATTGTTGRVTFKLNNAASGTYTTRVTNVTATGLTWDGATPPNSFIK